MCVCVCVSLLRTFITFSTHQNQSDKHIAYFNLNDFKNLAWATSFATRASRKFIYLPYRASGKKVIVIPCTPNMEHQLLYLQQNHAYAMMQSTYCVKSSGSLLSSIPALCNIFFRSSESCVVSLSRDEVAGLLFCCSRNSNSTAGSKKNITIFISEMCLEKQESNNKEKHNTHTHKCTKYMLNITQIYTVLLFTLSDIQACVCCWGGGRRELTVCVPA